MCIHIYTYSLGLSTLKPLAFPYTPSIGTKGLTLSRGPKCHVVYTDSKGLGFRV